MTPGIYNFTEVVKGDVFDEKTLTITKGITPINLTGATIKMDIRIKPGYDYAKRLSTENSGITITNATGGVFKINKFICDIDAAVYRYDIQITFQNGDVKTYLAGTFTVLQDVTR